MTRPIATTGAPSRPAYSGAGTQEINPHAVTSIPLPSGSIASPVAPLKSLNLSQAVLDGLVVVGGLIALVCVFGSIPLAVGLMIFGVL
jgi:hypothetical protein